MLTYGIIVLIVFLGIVALDAYNSYSPDRAVKAMKEEIEDIDNHPTWYYYVSQGIVWFIDLNIIGFLIYALTQI